MAHYYWYRTCPVCDGQGRLLLFRDCSSDDLYLHCEECESGWRDPEMAGQKHAGFLTSDENFEAEPATLADIAKHGWRKYAKHEFEDE